MSDMQATEADLAQDLKAFRKQFRKDHGRDPTRKDMNKHPAIAATYDEWIAIKFASSASSSLHPRASSSSSATSYKRKAPVDSPRQPASASFSNGTTSTALPMAPPPTTPSRKKPRQRYVSEETGLFKTPTKKNGSMSRLSPGAAVDSVHDSGGSVVDVPSSPKEITASPSLNRKQQKQANNARAVIYESPAKLRDLLSSFSSIQRTPTKSNMRDNLNVKVNGGTMPAYTPRTKARKRLRGEVVITPEKAPEREQASAASSRSIVQSAQKRRRGMAMNTLKDYGIVSVAGPPKSKAAGANRGPVSEKGKGVGFARDVRDETGHRDDGDGDDDTDEDDVLGPSPSLNRMVDRPVKTTQPLFGVEATGLLHNDDEGEEGVRETDAEVAKSKGAIPKKAGPAVLDEEDRDIVLVPYQRYKRSDSMRQDPAFSDEDGEDGMSFYDTFPIAAANGRTDEEPSTPPREASRFPEEQEQEQEQTPSLLRSLSLHSPQLKRARNMQRIKAEKSVRHLLGKDENLAILDEWDEGNRQEEEGTRKVEPLAKTNKVGPAIKGGRLMKSAKNFKPASSGSTKHESGETTTVNEESTTSSKLVFSNLREQLGSDQDSDLNADDDDSDEWASEVDSAEYGLGDGYMSEQD